MYNNSRQMIGISLFVAFVVFGLLTGNVVYASAGAAELSGGDAVSILFLGLGFPIITSIVNSFLSIFIEGYKTKNMRTVIKVSLCALTSWIITGFILINTVLGVARQLLFVDPRYFICIFFVIYFVLWKYIWKIRLKKHLFLHIVVVPVLSYFLVRGAYSIILFMIG